VLIGTAIFLSLVVIVLAVPVTVTYQLSWRETLSAHFSLDWAFGLVRTDISPQRSEPDKPGAVRKTVGRRRKSKGGKANVMAAIRQAPFRRRILRFVADLWRAIHKTNVRLLVRLGLGDPADTGRLWAVLGPISGMVARLRDIRIAIEPDFVDATCEVDSSGTVRLVPLQFVGLVLGLMFSPSLWRGILSMRSSG